MRPLRTPIPLCSNSCWRPVRTRWRGARVAKHPCIRPLRTPTPRCSNSLLAAGADPNARIVRPRFGPLNITSGETPLHRAGHNKNPTVVEMLLAAGAEIEARDEYGETPLHRAAQWSGNPAVVELLLSAGADPNARDHNGDTPLKYAKHGDVIELLQAARLGRALREQD